MLATFLYAAREPQLSSHTEACCDAQAEDEYMISDSDLFVTKYISVPKDMGQLNCASFVAGIVKGALDGAGFPARYIRLPALQSLMNTAVWLSGIIVMSVWPCLMLSHKILSLLVCRVTAHNVPVKGAPRPKTTILMKFEAAVMVREQRLPAM